MSATQRTRNDKLRDIRVTLNMSQSEFAAAVRKAGESLGEPNTCTRQLVQKWESGARSCPQQNYRRALQKVTSTPYAELGFGDASKVPANPLSIGDLIVSGTPSDHVLPLGEPSDVLRYALNRPEAATPQTVDLIADGTAYLFSLEYHRPARSMIPLVSQHIRDIAAILASTRRAPLRRRLAVAGGQAAALAGWLAFDIGDTITAHRYWDSALASSRYAGDGPLFACVLTYLFSP